MNSRRRAREIALQVLYALDANRDLDPATALALHFDRFAAADADEDAATTEAADIAYARTLVTEVGGRLPELDEIIGQLSRNWRVERMARVDRNVLRMAVYELKYRDDIPARVTLNEAIELAKRFGSAEASGFVNGLLDSALRVLSIRK